MNIRIALYFLLLFSLTTFGQEKFSYGVQTGLNYSSLRFSNENISEHNSEFGYTLGISTHYKIKNNLFFDAELNYDRKIVSVDVPRTVINNMVIVANDFTNYDTYEFISIPLSVRYNFSKNSKYYLRGGIFLNYFFRARERINQDKPSDDLSRYFENFDFGLILGLGRIFKLDSNNEIFIELRNSLGLIDIDKLSDPETTKTNSLNLFIGYRFKL
uniref:porin family protein n=1 Tax=uncultured Polaribacter sp. TaxID=174711 RepID=UPI00263926FD|nr:porin family protein [uncultured Polaribacter sp.]